MKKIVVLAILTLLFLSSISALGSFVSNSTIQDNLPITSFLGGKKRAVLVGVSDYANVNDLYYPTYDVRDIKNVLIENGWLERDITVLISQKGGDFSITFDFENTKFKWNSQ